MKEQINNIKLEINKKYEKKEKQLELEFNQKINELKKYLSSKNQKLNLENLQQQAYNNNNMKNEQKPFININNNNYNNIITNNTFNNHNYNNNIHSNNNNKNIINNWNNFNLPQNIRMEKIKNYSFECLNKNDLKLSIVEGEKALNIKLILKNNGTVAWPENRAKLIFNKKSHMDVNKEINLQPQKPQEIKEYNFTLDKLGEYPEGDYYLFLVFTIDGFPLEEKINLIISIKEQ